jgi:subtilase family protein
MSYRMLLSRRVTACFVLSAVTGLAMAGDVANGNGVLRFKTGDVFTTAASNMLARPAVPMNLTKRMAVVQLAGAITPAQRAQLEDAGVVLVEYLPDFAYAADLGGADLAALGRLGFVTWVGAFENGWKVSPDLGGQALASPQRQVLRDAGRFSVQVMLWPGANMKDTLAAIGQVPGVEIQESGWSGREMTLTATMPLSSAGAVAAIDAVRWIEDTPELDYRNATVRWVVQSNIPGNFPIHDHGLTGTGQILGLQDGRPDRNHCMLNDPEGDPPGPNHRKILAYNSSFGSDFHGTHVAGTAIGDNGVDNDTRGVAYDAKLVFDTIGFNSSAFLSNLNQHYGQGAAVHTNSWGNDGTTNYDALARTIDVFSWDNDDNLVIFAVTNTSTLKNPENAKNVLAVGASQDAGSAANFCSGGRGTTNDGRRKPEIFSPGCSIRSASAGTSCSTTGLTGTSMAAPSIAGSALLARQYYTDGFYPSGAANAPDGFTPSGALVKATLLNSTVDMTGIAGYPSDREGWGRVLLHNSLVFDDDAREIIVRDVRIGAAEAMNTGDFIEFQFDVNSLFQPLKVTLVWHDPPGSVNANPAYVNDLNLTVVAPTGTYLGNVFSGGISATGGSADFKNNVEMMYLPAPIAGTYTVRIDAAAVNVGTQGYALVITGDVTEASACAADWNGDGVLDFFDVQAFLADFSAMAAAADINNDGSFDFFDIQEFLNMFSAGCP